MTGQHENPRIERVRRLLGEWRDDISDEQIASALAQQDEAAPYRAVSSLLRLMKGPKV